jgi:hypothetical protein
VPVVPVALQGLWGSFFSRKGAPAMTRPLRRGLFTQIGIHAAAPLTPPQATPEFVQQRVAELRGDWR